MKYLRKSAAAVFGAAVIAGPALAGDEIRTIELFSRPQASQPAEFQSIQLIAQEWEKLGLDVEVKVMPWEQLSDIVWYQRDKWDATAWQMVGRPERSDPDEIVYNLFHSTTAEKGYNFIGYQNAAFDKVAEEQRITTDQDSRKNLLFEAQKILADDQPNMMLVHPKNAFAFDKTKFDESTVVEQSGIGIRNTWTFINAQPIGDNKDFILNSGDNVIAINPLYISGGVDSWIFELVYDRLMRVGPDGLPQPWAAESYDWKDGTTLEVTVPYGDVHQSEHHDPDQLSLGDVIQVPRVLVVEDDAGNRMILRKQLEKIGVISEGVQNGLEAVQAAMNEPWDMIIMDCQMPVMDGIEATREIRLKAAANLDTPIIAVTANASESYRLQCLEAGMDDYCTKPLRMEKLQRLVTHYAEHRVVTRVREQRGLKDSLID